LIEKFATARIGQCLEDFIHELQYATKWLLFNRPDFLDEI